MKKLLGLMAFIVFAFAANSTFAEEAPTSTNPPPPSGTYHEDRDHQADEAKLTYEQRLQKQYNLTEEQMSDLKNSKLPRPQMVMVAEIAKESGKSIDDVLKMRQIDKMGWGKIERNLGLKPGAIGRAVADFNREKHDRKDDRRKHKDDKKHRDRDDKKREDRDDKKRDDRDDKKREDRDDKKDESKWRRERSDKYASTDRDRRDNIKK